MHEFHKKLINGGCALALGVATVVLPGVATASGSLNHEPSGGEMLADAILVRPLMLVGTVFTTGAFIVTLPLSALGRNVDDAAKALVLEPAKYTFVRPLGDM